MTDQWDAHFFRLPAGASKRDRQVGYTELGEPLYEAPNGTRYSFDVSLNAPKEAQQSSPNMLVNHTLPDGRVYHDYAPRQNQNALAATDIIGGLAQGIANPFLTPGRALRGEPVTHGDVLELAAMTNLGASMFEAPKGALRSGAVRTADDLTPGQAQADDIMRLLREGRGADVTDDMMAAADQAYLSRIYDLPLDDASRMQRGRSMFEDEIERASDDLYWDKVGVRSVEHPRYFLSESRHWDDGVRTRKKIGGTSAVSASDDAVARQFSGEYPGDFKAVLGSDIADWGDDIGEIVMRNPELVFARNAKTARFDPRLAHLRNLSAGVGGAAVGLNALSPQQADAQEIIDYLSGQR